MQGLSEQISNPVWLIYFIVLLPIISAFAAHFMSRDALLVIYLMIGLAISAVRLRLRATFADSFFLVLIGAVALSLFLSGTLISSYVTGWDAHQEFALFQQAAQQGGWQPEVSILYNSALSVTILPLIISSVSSLDGILVFKIVYPFLFSMVPMLLYQLYRKIMNPEAAFLSVFVVLSYQATYTEITQLGRQMIAELIMVLLLWLQLSPTLGKTRVGSFLVVLLTFGLVTSHYSIALIYILLIIFSYLVSRKPRFGMESLVSSSRLALSLVATVGWFLFVAGGIVLQNLSQNLEVVTAGLTEFFNLTARPSVVMEALGLANVHTEILHLMNRATQYLVVFCIILGFLFYMRKSKNIRAEKVLLSLMVPSMGFLIASVVFPYLATALQLSRIYHIALLLISPCFYFGAVKLADGLRRLCTLAARHPIRIQIGRDLAATILFLYLLLTSGWVWAITLDLPTSQILDHERIANSSNVYTRVTYYWYYTLSEDVAAALWLRSHTTAGRLICADFISRYHVLNSYGGYQRIGPTLPSGCDLASQYVYLGVGNSILGVGTTWPAHVYWLNDTMRTLPAENRVYSDGAAIYESF